jgi:hypothetical protein
LTYSSFCIYISSTSLTTPSVFQVYRACREFIYDKGNLNGTTWIEPEPKQWIELICAAKSSA